MLRTHTTSPLVKSLIFAVLVIAAGVGIALSPRLLEINTERRSKAADNKPPITGTFISFPWSKLANYTLSDWQKEFDSMEELGFKTIIVAGVVIKGYGVPGGTKSYYEHLNTIFDLADTRGFSVYVGPADLENWYANPTSKAELLTMSKTAAREIFTTHGNRNSFAGWYIQPEAMLNIEYTDYFPWDELTTYFKSLSSPPKKVIISPYVMPPCSPGRFRCDNQWWPNRTPQEIAELTKKFLLNTNIDILAPQDGVGATKVTMQELEVYLPAMAQAATSLGREFWVDMEIFRYNDANTQFIPADFAQVRGQIDREKQYPIVIWIFHQFMDPDVSTDTQKLYNAYKTWYILPSPTATPTLTHGTTATPTPTGSTHTPTPTDATELSLTPTPTQSGGFSSLLTPQTVSPTDSAPPETQNGPSSLQTPTPTQAPSAIINFFSTLFGIKSSATPTMYEPELHLADFDLGRTEEQPSWKTGICKAFLSIPVIQDITRSWCR